MKTLEGAPAVASETTAKPAKKTRKAVKATATPTIARRKVLAGKHKTTGAPKLPVIGLTEKRRKGPFTLMDIFKANGETISLLTIKKRKKELIKAGELVKDTVAAKRQHEGHGRPPEYFNFDLTQGTVVKARKGKAKAAKTAPVVAAEGQAATEAAPAAEQNPVQQPAETQPEAQPATV